MAITIFPDGTARAFTYLGIKDAQRQLGGYFDSVGGQLEVGYLCLVHETGVLDGLPRNPAAEILTGYPVIHGPACIVSFEEARERDRMYRVRPIDREAFEQRLKAITNLQPCKV